VPREHARAVGDAGPVAPEPWMSSTAAPLREGTYQAATSPPSSIAIRTS